MTWRDLSDDELRARLLQRGVGEFEAGCIVRQRENPTVARDLDELFDEKGPSGPSCRVSGHVEVTPHAHFP